MSLERETAVQNAVVAIMERFAPFSTQDDGPYSVTDVLEYLSGQGFPEDISSEATQRHVAANDHDFDPWATSLPCPFCGCEDIDARPMQTSCSACNATAESGAAWNTRTRSMAEQEAQYIEAMEWLNIGVRQGRDSLQGAVNFYRGGAWVLLFALVIALAWGRV